MDWNNLPLPKRSEPPSPGVGRRGVLRMGRPRDGDWEPGSAIFAPMSKVTTKE